MFILVLISPIVNNVVHAPVLSGRPNPFLRIMCLRSSTWRLSGASTSTASGSNRASPTSVPGSTEFTVSDSDGWTDEEGETEPGQFDTTAVLGNHDLTVSLPDSDVTASLSTDDLAERSVEIRVITIDVLNVGQDNDQIRSGSTLATTSIPTTLITTPSSSPETAGRGGEVVHRPCAPNCKRSNVPVQHRYIGNNDCIRKG